MEVNNINDQLDATITILLIFESAQHVSGNILPIFRSVRLWLQQRGVLSNVVVSCRFRVRRHILRRRTPDLQPTTLDNTPHCFNHSLTLLKIGKNCPKHIELIQRSIKLLLLHLVGHLYYSPSLIMHEKTQIKSSSRSSFIGITLRSRESRWNVYFYPLN